MNHPILPQTEELRIKSLDSGCCFSIPCTTLLLSIPRTHSSTLDRHGIHPNRGDHRRPGSRAPVAMPPCRSCGGDHRAALASPRRTLPHHLSPLPLLGATKTTRSPARMPLPAPEHAVRRGQPRTARTCASLPCLPRPSDHLRSTP